MNEDHGAWKKIINKEDHGDQASKVTCWKNLVSESYSWQTDLLCQSSQIRVFALPEQTDQELLSPSTFGLLFKEAQRGHWRQLLTTKFRSPWEHFGALEGPLLRVLKIFFTSFKSMMFGTFYFMFCVLIMSS